MYTRMLNLITNFLTSIFLKHCIYYILYITHLHNIIKCIYTYIYIWATNIIIVYIIMTKYPFLQKFIYTDMFQP